MPEEKWITFWVDSEFDFGLMSRPDIWREFVKSSPTGLARLLKMKSNSMESPYPDFGEGVRYSKFPTLGQWAKDKGINLAIP